MAASGTGIVLGALGLCGLCAQGVKPGDQKFLEQKVSVTVVDKSVFEIVRALRNDYKVPLCYIEPEIHTSPPKKISLDLRAASLRSVLDSVVSQSPVSNMNG